MVLAQALPRRCPGTDMPLVDAPQGDGTAAIFEGDASVFTLSVHCAAQSFPAELQRSDRDVALPAGTTDAQYMKVRPPPKGPPGVRCSAAWEGRRHLRRPGRGAGTCGGLGGAQAPTAAWEGRRHLRRPGRVAGWLAGGCAACVQRPLAAGARGPPRTRCSCLSQIPVRRCGTGAA
jgi:hypothetical protein